MHRIIPKAQSLLFGTHFAASPFSAALIPASVCHKSTIGLTMGDINNTSAIRPSAFLKPDIEYSRRSFAFAEAEDNSEIRKLYRPFLMAEEITNSDWISRVELSTALKMVEQLLQCRNDRLKVLVLYGSMRKR
jgi:arsenic resistance protein ArsH